MTSYQEFSRTYPITRDREDFAAAVASSVVLSVDPFAQTTAPDYWNWSESAHRAVVDALLSPQGTPLSEATVQLLEHPENGTYHHHLQHCVQESLAVEPNSLPARLAEAAWAAERVSRLRVHVGSDWQTHSKGAALDELRGMQQTRQPATGPFEAAVVIPFRGRDPQSARIRNLLAVLRALDLQTCARHRYRTIVVEADSEPRWKSVVAPACDTYIFAPATDRFNKAWAVNVGVVQGAAEAEAICVLDADILVDADFVARALERFDVPGTQAHWPFQDMLFLDEKSSEMAIHARSIEHGSSVNHDLMRGVYMRRPPGGCIWLRNGLFRRIGGMDERFEGWGGEDQDFEWRVDRYGTLDRHADPIVHLNHPRSPYRADDGTPFFQDISFCSWPCDSEIGNLQKYSDLA
ncbi:glycosyltransferase [Streptomyces sp. NPDC048644]|uniref:glycosyltransferase n=1 Tax=Streptomyces sp. NPDC048644 TaxID=3365582 RepID=UPI00370FB8F3